MRTLWLVRRNLETHPGGDTVQILRTAEALRTLGVTVDLCDRPAPALDQHDIVHLFHLDRLWENVAHCRRIRRAATPAVLSTIYWPSDEFDHAARAGFQGRLSRTIGSNGYRTSRLLQRGLLALVQHGNWRALDGRLLNFNRAARYVLSTVGMLLPNSQAELDVIEQQFGVKPPAVIVPNAVDGATFHKLEGDAAKRVGVLCVGRIEPRKNQFALIRALRDTDIQLRLVGGPGRFSRRYYEECRRSAGANTTFVDHRAPDALRHEYNAARVHACVSWYETPGLASLEAASCGCAVVVTPGGSTREYFGDDAAYCDPDDPNSIRAAIQQALTSEIPRSLTARVARDYTWEAAARKTLEAYELALARQSSGQRNS